jgi:phosphatidylserine/phosphatidylglycerophosphate/cardiolipin synthase-like enzyme
MESYQTIKSPWEDSFYDLLGSARRNLLLVSPFMKQAQAIKLIDRLDAAGVTPSIHVGIMTDLRPDSILAGVLDIESLLAFAKSTPNLTITYLPNLHAKVYVADDHTAVITSANFTDGGLRRNFEYGVVATDTNTVAKVLNDMRDYAALGSLVTHDSLESMASISKDLKGLRQKAERSIRREFRRAFNEKLEEARIQLLTVRAEGKTTHGIFADTILYLLARQPMRTTDMHPMIQRLHPDLCDDHEDRVIKGVHFGKKWKHYVRNAQQHLKRQGLITFDGTYWRLTRRVAPSP